MTGRIDVTNHTAYGPLDADGNLEHPEHRWGYHVQVKDPDGVGTGAEIWLDGERLRYVKRYVVDVGTNTASTVTVTFNAQSVNREPLP